MQSQISIQPTTAARKLKSIPTFQMENKDTLYNSIKTSSARTNYSEYKHINDRKLYESDNQLMTNSYVDPRFIKESASKSNYGRILFVNSNGEKIPLETAEDDHIHNNEMYPINTQDNSYKEKELLNKLEQTEKWLLNQPKDNKEFENVNRKTSEDEKFHNQQQNKNHSQKNCGEYEEEKNSKSYGYFAKLKTAHGFEALKQHKPNEYTKLENNGFIENKSENTALTHNKIFNDHKNNKHHHELSRQNFDSVEFLSCTTTNQANLLTSNNNNTTVAKIKDISITESLFNKLNRLQYSSKNLHKQNIIDISYDCDVSSSLQECEQEAKKNLLQKFVIMNLCLTNLPIKINSNNNHDCTHASTSASDEIELPILKTISNYRKRNNDNLKYNYSNDESTDTNHNKIQLKKIANQTSIFKNNSINNSRMNKALQNSKGIERKYIVMNTIICLIFITFIIYTTFYLQTSNLGNAFNFKTLINLKPKKKPTINEILFELLNLWVDNIKTILSKLYPF